MKAQLSLFALLLGLTSGSLWAEDGDKEAVKTEESVKAEAPKAEEQKSEEKVAEEKSEDKAEEKSEEKGILAKLFSKDDKKEDEKKNDKDKDEGKAVAGIAAPAELTEDKGAESEEPKEEAK